MKKTEFIKLTFNQNHKIFIIYIVMFNINFNLDIKKYSLKKFK